MPRPLLALGFTILLSACGEPTVHSTCYKNGDHARLSDGRITRICDCVDATVKAANATPQEVKWAIAWLKGDALEARTTPEKKAAAAITASMTRIKAHCEARR